MAGLDQQPRVGAQEVRGHRHLRPVGQHEVGPVAELLDEAEDVVPAAAVEPGDVVAQLVEDLVHLEGGQDRLDQHRGLDRAARQAQLVPGPARRRRSTAALRGGFPAWAGRSTGPLPLSSRAWALWKKYRPKSKSEPEIGWPSTEHVLLVEVPAARPDHQRGGVLVERVLLALGAGVLDRAADRVAQVDLALERGVPGGRVRVLEVGHEHLRAGVERVDDHLAIDRAGDLDAAVVQVGRDRARPASRPRGCSPVSGRKSGSSPRVEPGLDLRPAGQQLPPPAVEGPVQLGHERQGLGREDLLRTRA